MVNPRHIVVDHRYQRDENKSLIAMIAGHPDWRRFGVPVCFKRGETFYCADGQQRINGLLASEHPPLAIPIVWWPVTKLADEAEVFVAINVFRRALHAYDKHRGSVVAEDPASLAIERAVGKAGYTLDAYASNPNSIASIGTVMKIYNRIGEEGLVRTLVQIRESWPGDRLSLQRPFLILVSEVVAEQGEQYSRSKVTTALAKTTPAELSRRAKQLAFDIGGSQQTNLRRALKEASKL
jgi:hypothetical protein